MAFALGVQRELTPTMAIEIRYLGTRSRKHRFTSGECAASETQLLGFRLSSASRRGAACRQDDPWT